ncbi:MAG TPA: hypothetical protein PKJ70_01185 [Chitinophagaceae bacterium]|nr:hypothetical protein [Chitinophagaceae bacterium]HNN30483.1 hypothetical protein [Chitinophagaceae bacterium]
MLERMSLAASGWREIPSTAPLPIWPIPIPAPIAAIPAPMAATLPTTAPNTMFVCFNC